MKNLMLVICVMFLFFCELLSQDMNYPIHIDCNVSMSEVYGIPVDIGYKLIKIPSTVKDTTLLVVDGNKKLLLDKKGNLIHFKYYTDGEFLKGLLFIPEETLLKYASPYDPETLMPIVVLEKYYKPIRHGIWISKIDGEEQKINCNFRYEKRNF
ncbi:hypothetical protein PPO43_00175 [Saprospira sp. CCB-QB6]|uniref:hypothetical protein n=1 Tax=Saprospira sp. CCB-QB6 TaxID=3023936 RepID=UPI00234ADA52|nr:hypothetical protein [Saprospira sp. CCB-QB6]WCL81511.1 hypothetical protein PPO43_00175 [Saprospira sp. CCB-QB6]